MSIERIRANMLFLAGELPHRSAVSELEKRAAVYLADRLREHTPHVELDSFSTMDNPLLLFASYYAEFMVVAIIAFWWPLAAAVYGAFVFGCYLAEFLGYRVLARLMPPFHTQNVTARFLAQKPKYLFIVTANYDSARETPLTRPGAIPLLRPLHFAIIAAMVLVIATCAVEGLGLFNPGLPVHLSLRWTAVGTLLTAAAILYYSGATPVETRGANTNGAGVCALLELAERLDGNPIENADLWLVATGAQSSWMSGMRRLLADPHLDRERTYILNIESVGAGRLHYLTSEGMLHHAQASPAMRRAAEAVHGAYDAHPARFNALPLAGDLPLARGLQTLTIAGLGDDGFPPYWSNRDDTLAAVDEDAVSNATAFGEALLRRLARDLP